MNEKICSIIWKARDDSFSPIVDISAVAPDGTVLFSRNYQGGRFYNEKTVQATYNAVYNWTQENGYTLRQKEAKS